MANPLYFGDNLEVLRESIKDESVDLISTRLSTTGYSAARSNRATRTEVNDDVSHLREFRRLRHEELARIVA